MDTKQLRMRFINLRNLPAAILLGMFAMASTACMAEVGSDVGTEEDEEAELGSTESALRNGVVPDTWGKGIVAVHSSFSGGVMRCTGTFITRFDVLTSAHCIRSTSGVKASKVQVSFGADWNGTKHTAARYVSFSKWTNSQVFANDLAVVSFNSPIAPSGTAMPVADFAMPSGSFEGQQVVMAGYGMENSAASSAGKKRWAYGKIKTNSGNQLQVTGEGGAVSCDGDSGGPIAKWDGKQWVVVGVIAGGTGNNCTTSGTTYAAMPTSQLKFIDDNLSIGVIVIP